ncbi:MAG TPA: 2OG-Fe(II) oxygenase [Povalibacter sp.]
MTTATRTASVDGRDVAVFDNLVAPEEASRYFNAIAHAAFTRTETARPEAPDFRHWVCDMPLENLPRTSLWSATQQALAVIRPGEEFRPYRCYTNYAAYGDVLLTHVDSAPGAREITALWFLCERWDIEWGGETLFFDATGDAQIAVAPRPGRLLLFDGAIRHAGRAPNRNCHVARYTFAIKLRAVR